MIRLDDKYVIEVEECCYRLGREVNSIDKRTGKRKTTAIGYYKDMQGALTAYGDEVERQALSGDIDLEGAIRAIEEARTTVRGTIERAIGKRREAV